ncbi:MAG TPA: hypothetical protein VGR35_01380 [Tepidisphaeraceae bacterium]|nr:hypothetical protein [Tepidisphaeraceae bacterium]
MRISSTHAGSLAVGIALLLVPVTDAGYADDVGYTQLKAELGAATPSGSSVSVTQVEGRNDVDAQGNPLDAFPNYLPDAANAQFAGKTINARTPGGQVSSHATAVGQYFYGSTSSIAPGITTIDAFEVNDWLGSGWLRTGSTSAPVSDGRKVQNHSWVGSAGASDPEILRRLDYAINNNNGGSGFTAVVGLNNGSGNAHPPLLSNAYNAIAVGRSDGNHSRGTTTADGAGRVKPDLVVPLGATSWATPVVGAAAALVIDKSNTTPALANASRPQAVKAILMAGATKAEFGAAWDRTPTRPLDEVFGAGELNVYRSYHVLTAGEQAAGSASLVSTTGWDFATAASTTQTYYFDVPAMHELTELSTILTWNRVVQDGVAGPSFGNLTSSLANLDLQLYTVDGFSLGTLLDQSISAVDNVEHIYRPTALTAGRYAMQVTTDTLNTNYALAWHGSLTAVPEPGAAAVVAMMTGWMLARRRRVCG